MVLYVRTNPVRVAIATWPWGAYLGEDGLKKGIRAKTSSFNRHHPNAAMTKGKVIGNYVNSVLAKWEVMKAGYDEAVLLDTEGYVAEGSGENIFIVRNGVLITTPLTSILPGITRDAVLTIARKLDIPVKESRFTRDEMYIADEMFFTGAGDEADPGRLLRHRPGEGQVLLQLARRAVALNRPGGAKPRATMIRCFASPRCSPASRGRPPTRVSPSPSSDSPAATSAAGTSTPPMPMQMGRNSRWRR